MKSSDSLMVVLSDGPLPRITIFDPASVRGVDVCLLDSNSTFARLKAVLIDVVRMRLMLSSGFISRIKLGSETNKPNSVVRVWRDFGILGVQILIAF